jgi:glycosyltransferase involved in cell wall biosynthesis
VNRPNHSVSVIIPCHNGEQFLTEAVESVLAQTVVADEIIVVDDGSTDATPQIVSRYPQLRYLRQAQQGVSRSRNTAAAASQGDYIVFLDHDDRLLPQALELGLAAFAARPQSGFVFGLCRNIDVKGELIEHAQLSALEQHYEPPYYPKLLQGDSIHPPARLMIQRQAFEAIGGFDPSLTVAEDYDLYLRLAAAYPGFCHNQPVVEYRNRDDSVSHRVRSTQHLLASLQVLDKQKPKLQDSPEYEIAYQQGRVHWQKVYSPYLLFDLIKYLKAGQMKLTLSSLLLTLRYRPQSFLEYGLIRLGLRKMPGAL